MSERAKRRVWSSHAKADIVLESLQGKPVSQLCREHALCQSLFYKWKETFFSNAFRAFEARGLSERVTALEEENERLKRKVGELLLTLNGGRTADG